MGCSMQQRSLCLNSSSAPNAIASLAGNWLVDLCIAMCSALTAAAGATCARASRINLHVWTSPCSVYSCHTTSTLFGGGMYSCIHIAVRLWSIRCTLDCASAWGWISEVMLPHLQNALICFTNDLISCELTYWCFWLFNWHCPSDLVHGTGIELPVAMCLL